MRATAILISSMARMFDFAKVADWDGRLNTLAELAEPERWTYVLAPSTSPLPVLDSYIKYTFSRAFDQQKIVEADQLACFNTGLLTPGQEEIFGVFTVSDSYVRTQPMAPNNKKWWLKSWARAGDKVLTDFMEFPRLADYWTDPRELIFDPKLQVQLNLDHIIKDNLNRFPEELGGKVDRNGVPTDLGDQSDEEDFEQPEAHADDRPIPLATRNALEGAMKHSIRLAQRSYRIAVPQFFRNRIQLLLPLYLRHSSRADLALTLERHGGWYRAATVLYTDWAYVMPGCLLGPIANGWAASEPISWTRSRN